MRRKIQEVAILEFQGELIRSLRNTGTVRSINPQGSTEEAYEAENIHWIVFRGFACGA